MSSTARTPAVRMTLATLVLALGSAFALTASAQPAGGPPPMMMMMGGHHLDRALDAAGVGADQKSQVKAILDAAHKDLAAQHDAAQSLHQKMAQLFTQPTVDANAVEQLRQQMLAQHDQASKRMMQAMLEVSRVLTPEQRQKIVQQMAQHRGMMMERRHGGASAPAR